MTIKLNSNALKYLSLAVFLFITVFTSCEKEVDIQIPSKDPSVVIEGQIENDLPPFVLITKSIGFFDKVDLSVLEENFVHDALVIISDGTITDTLREYAADTGSGAKFYFYSVDTATLGNAIIAGEFNKHYKLSVTHEGKTYEAITKIPSVPEIDVFRGDKKRVIRFPETPEEAVGLYISVKDPDTSGNYFRYFTKRNAEPYYPVDVVDPQELGANGEYFDKIQIGFGYDRTLQDSANLIYPIKGDSITLKWCAVDRQVYTFWETFSFAINVVGNPFASPTNVPSNFSNGALGVWAGYGARYIQIQGYDD
jgi:hypothetical protein